ncbi:uncharacterized protein LAESUDRAFT_496402 [Laetiporus sulphureus 93-53]|uniref:Uncharacterized protein n=1 Tax=Laetiporus sulphureus 93-53 TaxID=1314785 RepID=A0A165BGX1_9APHY|nr:uncharacterized protein LAESUDRAFT_496402 [Laetiporus sulphureus 93-53]KZT01031.1 hypothetical protein LAESUDRAFT_496402 [Laetiporus sulphureus 93-53]
MAGVLIVRQMRWVAGLLPRFGRDPDVFSTCCATPVWTLRCYRQPNAFRIDFPLVALLGPPSDVQRGKTSGTKSCPLKYKANGLLDIPTRGSAVLLLSIFRTDCVVARHQPTCRDGLLSCASAECLKAAQLLCRRRSPCDRHRLGGNRNALSAQASLLLPFCLNPPCGAHPNSEYVLHRMYPAATLDIVRTHP